MRRPAALPSLLFVAVLSLTSFGQFTSHPDALAGRWEAPDGQGNQIGINLSLTTSVLSCDTSLVGVPQKVESLNVLLYERPNGRGDPVERYFFSTAQQGGASWDGAHLRVAVPRQGPFAGAYLDLTWRPTPEVWAGLLELGALRNPAIILRRPSSRNFPFVGTWFAQGECLHIVQAQDGTLSGWKDQLLIPGYLRYANGIRPPDRSFEQFGTTAIVNDVNPNGVDITLNPYTAGCCSQQITLFSRSRNRLQGNWPPSSLNAGRGAIWTRVQGNSCIAAASHPPPTCPNHLVKHKAATTRSLPGAD